MRFVSWLPIALLACVPPFSLPVGSLCGFKWLTGLPCPFCGLTHGLIFWMHGDWSQAIHWHLLTPLVFLLMLLFPLRLPRSRAFLPLLTLLFACYTVWRWV